MYFDATQKNAGGKEMKAFRSFNDVTEKFENEECKVRYEEPYDDVIEQPRNENVSLTNLTMRQLSRKRGKVISNVMKKTGCTNKKRFNISMTEAKRRGRESIAKAIIPTRKESPRKREKTEHTEVMAGMFTVEKSHPNRMPLNLEGSFMRKARQIIRLLSKTSTT